MPKQCEIVAVASGIKPRTQRAITDVYHQLQRPDVFKGLSRTYQPKFEDGDQYPPETKRLEANVDDCIKEVVRAWTELWDVVATQDVGNSEAVGTIEVDGATLEADLPAPTLIFLEKQLADVRSFIDRLPTLDPTREWEFSKEANCYVTQTERAKTRKVAHYNVAYEATKEHPAQIDKDYVDEVEGYWKTLEMSGAITEARKKELLDRCNQLLDAIKIARERANATNVDQIKIGNNILGWLFE